jgi:hypothetical protein
VLTIFFRLVGIVHLMRIDALERRLGYRLDFAGIPKGWTPGIIKLNLTRRWHAFGLKVTGVDYFTLGSPENGVSTRFDETANQYQSWFGGYLVRFHDSKSPALQDCLDLAVVDQYDWLRHYGDPDPVCGLHENGFRRVTSFELDGFAAQLYEGGGISHSDLGTTANWLWLVIVRRLMAALFNLSNSKLQLSHKSFLPNKDEAYRQIVLRGYIVVVEIEERLVAVLYGNGAVFKNSDGRTKDKFALIRGELLASLRSVRILKVGPHSTRKER